MNLRSISFRLVAWYASLLAAIFLLLCSLLYLDLRLFLENQLRESQLRRARQIANTLIANVRESGEAQVAKQTADWYDPEINGRFIRITRADGSPVYVSGPPKDGSFIPADVPALASVRRREFTRKIKLPGDKTMLITGLRCEASGMQTYRVEFGELLDPVETMLNHFFLQLTL